MGPGTDEAPTLAETDLRLWRRIAETVTPLWPRAPMSAPPDEQAMRDQRAMRGEQAGPGDGGRSRPAAEGQPSPGGAHHGRRERPTPSRTPELGHGVAPGLDKRSLIRLRKGQLRIDGRLDLHGFTQVEARHRLAAFLAASVAADRRCVLVITGKGSRGDGILRQEVPRWLNESDNRACVIGFCHAIPPDGGEGALYVLLRRRRPPRPAMP